MDANYEATPMATHKQCIVVYLTKLSCLLLLSRLKGMLVSVLLVAVALVPLQSATAQDKNTITAELRAGHYSDARRMLEKALKESPADAALWTLNGFALSHLGQEKDALASYRRALQLSPEYLPALEGAAEIEYRSSGQAAVPLLKKLVALHPGDETSHAMLATLAFDRRDCGVAVAEFRQARALTSSKVKSLQEYGSCLLQVGQSEEAVKIFEQVRAITPHDERAGYNVAVAQLMAKRYADAIATLKPLVAARPGDGDAWDILGQAYEGLLDTPNAVASLRQAMTRNPDVARYYLDFADVCLAHAAYKIGVDMLNVGLRRIPGSASLYLARGILYVQMGDYDNSRRDFDRAEQLDPDIQYGRGMQGLADLQSNNLSQAEEDVRKRLAKAPGDAFLRYLLADTLLRRGATAGTPQFREALRSAEKAVQLRSDFSLARNLLARLYLEEGRNEDAIQQSRLAFQEDPNGKTGETALYHLITALRKSGKQDQIPSLAKKLAELREQARAKETAEHSYTLVEAKPSAVNKQ